MAWVTFRNPGELDINLIKLMGVSVKHSDSAIGFFGTGLKYAIATILRHGGEIRLSIGNREHEITQRSVTIRDKEFRQVVLDNEPLGFTTDLGKQWEPWMAVRELYSNALDEGGAMELGESPSSNSGTCIAIRGEEFTKIWNERDNYFLFEATPYLTQVDGGVYQTRIQSKNIFNKGIKIGEATRPTCFKYDIKTNIRLTEDRTIAWMWQVDEAIERIILTSDCANYIRSALTSGPDYMEGNLGFSDPHTGVIESSTFKSVCEALSKERPTPLNQHALNWYERRIGKEFEYTPAALTFVQKTQLQKALKCLEALGFKEDLELYPIKVVRWMGGNIYGLAKDGQIYLSRECFDKGTKYVAATLLEEFVHCHFGYGDHTRELQTWLFDRVITVTEEFAIREAL